MANYNPRLENLIPRPMIGDKPSKKTIGVRVTEEVYEDFVAIPSDIRSKLLREFIEETSAKFKADRCQ